MRDEFYYEDFREDQPEFDDEGIKDAMEDLAYYEQCFHESEEEGWFYSDDEDSEEFSAEPWDPY